jgi:hypothetical protein
MKSLYKLLPNLKSKILQLYLYFFYSQKKNDLLLLTNELIGLKLNLGCGNLYKENWVNIDIDKSIKTDICSDFMSVHNNFQFNSVKAISMIHSVSYLNLWEARIFFKNMYDLLIQRGVFELEFPDAIKCAKVLSTTKSTKQYIEAIRGIYAFDLNQINNQENFKSYSFGWSAWFIKLELQKVGFKEVRILRPLTHGEQNWRDTRIIAIK